MAQHDLFVVPPPESGEALLSAIERGMAAPIPALDAAALSSVVQGDAFLAEQLAALRADFELRPQAGAGAIGRLRVRLGWWLLGPELAQSNATNAALIRVIDSLIAAIDAERAARRRADEPR